MTRRELRVNRFVNFSFSDFFSKEIGSLVMVGINFACVRVINFLQKVSLFENKTSTTPKKLPSDVGSRSL